MQEPTPPFVAPSGFTLGQCIGGLHGRTLVFAAIDRAGHPCALKTLDRVQTPTAVAVARFETECRIHRLANGCRHVIPLHDESTTDGLVLAWAHGGSLDALCARPDAKPFPRERVIAIVRALLGACVCLHERGIVHRDIKPSNILLDGPQIWLADFGVAATNTPSGRWESLPAPWREMEVGTIGWVAPELRANPQDISPKNDVYSVGRLWEWVFARSDSDERTDLPLQKSMTDPDPAARPTAADVLRRL